MSGQVPSPRAPATPAAEAGPSRPASRRPRTSAAQRRPASARPDTAATTASDIGELPDQQFFREGLDEEEEYDDDDGVEDDVFAFERPVTGAVPRVAFTETTTSLGQTGDAPKTADTAYTGQTAFTGQTGHTGQSFGMAGSSASAHDHGHNFAFVPEPTGNMDVGGHIPELHYDVHNPPPFAGRENLNNSSFANTNRKLQAQAQARESGTRPTTGRSLLSKLHRRQANTATTETSVTTNYTVGATTEYTSERDSETGSFTTELTGSGKTGMSQRHKASAPLLPGFGATGSVSDFSSDATPGQGHGRGYSRGSYGMTEMSGDMTVPDGKTTWGDGMATVPKEGSEGESLGAVDFDLAEEDSPFAEVRASVSNIDDVDMPALTIRSWVLGMLFAIICTGANTFFSFRTPAPFISAMIIEVVVYPIGKFAAWALPIRTWTLPRWLGGVQFSFNPGPFNIKEHALIVIMANISLTPAYALYSVVASELWYGHDFGVGFSILLMLSTQLTGFAFAGLCRRFVVWPASMIWPSVLAVSTSLNAFHAEDEGYEGGMTRIKFLVVCGGAAFAWFFVPGFLFTALSYFSFICWIWPRSSVVNQLFGVSTGLGYSMITLDWTQITWIGNPLVVPWWAQVNYMIGFVLFYWIVVPIIYYTNVWYTAYLPINVGDAADRFGSSYDIFAILTPEITLNLTAYQEYSPVYLSATFSMTFMLAFAVSTGLIVHTALYHGPRIYYALRNVRAEVDDIHMKLMRYYPEVPDWWFLVLFGICFVFAVVGIEVFDTGLPVWGYLLSVLLPFIYTLPAVFIYAMTTQQISVNILGELIPGYLFSGQPVPGMIFKTFSVQTLLQTLLFVQDQKLGHYMKIPPRSTFIAQLSASIICGLVQVATKHLLFAVVPDMCASQQANHLTCSYTKVFFTSSIIWGLVGPGRLFSKGYLYNPQLWALLIGAILPIPLWFWVRRRPRSIFRNLNIPVVLNGGFAIPPATGMNYASFFITGFAFQFWIRRRFFAWWSKYNYILAIALDVGTALSALFIFLVLDLPGVNLKWWGTTVFQNTADWSGEGASYLTAPPTGFGPDVW